MKAQQKQFAFLSDDLTLQVSCMSIVCHHTGVAPGFFEIGGAKCGKHEQVWKRC